MNHQFHYESEKQAQRWLSLHEAYSPARTDDDCLKTYERAFSEVGQRIDAPNMSVISIGCGGGQKDLALLKALRVKRLRYVPTDVSLPLALTAHLRARKELGIESKPAVLDLPNTPALQEFLSALVPAESLRMFAFFGMLPNFEPAEALNPLAKALRENDLLLLSANLAPGNDYRAGVEHVLPLYDNDLTRQWLATSLTDAGLELSPTDITFSIQSVGKLLRIEANYAFQTRQTIRLDSEDFAYELGDRFRLFFSYRHTPDLLRELLAPYSIQIAEQWITRSGEEGVFLCRKRAA